MRRIEFKCWRRLNHLIVNIGLVLGTITGAYSQTIDIIDHDMGQVSDAFSEISTLGGWALFGLPILMQGIFYIKNHNKFRPK